MGKKKIDFSTVRRVSPVLQTEDTNGVVKEKNIYSSFDLDQELYKKLKIYLATKNVTAKKFFEYCINEILDGKVPVPVPDVPAITDKKFKMNLYMKESNMTKLKIWVSSNGSSIKQVITFMINKEVENISKT